jgi:hypothetical protein
VIIYLTQVLIAKVIIYLMQIVNRAPANTPIILGDGFQSTIYHASSI